MTSPTPPGIEPARRILGLSDQEIAWAVGADEATLAAWRRGDWPTGGHLHRLKALDALVREIEDTMRPEVVSDWMQRPLGAHEGATPHSMIVGGHFEPLLGTLNSLNRGFFLGRQSRLE